MLVMISTFQDLSIYRKKIITLDSITSFISLSSKNKKKTIYEDAKSKKPL